jgi:hypothetical protein
LNKSARRKIKAEDSKMIKRYLISFNH